ncbi:MAG: hypothetical protein A2015_10530 [Spirochaetes bacterium GWF1_31_7]|nr:MAG: hypothetical protein A2Y30_16270 [Spirochaetes bacterium GWE1_32_154]OHD48534.1 MAG: hypothetical protein A2Y29_14245 [Spirochaetes bacterium GWE2_31_10]OHD51449.1 MAG: hypothetical protein A2015_10530 [Spirochaetes bacterium GWF1_31_7]OHD80009.1 MAG: hypothetical protein A2355_12215 [Spirochaetes bacterium RIFOXYB1_FULL_32_8]HBD93336.1 hypothetical protein [Spirochaetia bacterium]
MNESVVECSHELVTKNRRFESLYSKIVLGYFVLVLLFIFVFQRFFPHIYIQLFFRIFIALIVLMSLILHHFLKATYFLVNRKSVDFLSQIIKNKNIDISSLTFSDIEKIINETNDFSLRDKKSILLNFNKLITQYRSNV